MILFFNDSRSTAGRLRALGFSALLLGLSACRYDGGDELRVVGTDSLGRERSIPFSARLMARPLARTMRELDRSTLSAIEVQASRTELELARVTVGLELELEAEIAEVVELGVEGVFEMRYQPLPVSTAL